MRAKLYAIAAGLVLALVPYLMAATVGGLPSKPTFTQVRVGNIAAALSSAHIDVQAPSATDPAIATYRASSGVGVGVGRLRFDGQDIAAARQPYGLIQAEIVANTASAQSGALVFQTALAGTTAERFRIDGNSGTGTGTISITGCTAATTPAYRYTRVGNLVTLHIESWGCTSNSTATGAAAAARPTAIRPATSVCVAGAYGTDNGANFIAPVMVRVVTDGSLNFDRAGGTSCANASWTGSGSKGLAPMSLSYTVQ